LAQKVAEALSETHREGTSHSSESNSWNQLFNRPFTLLAFGGGSLPVQGPKGRL